MTDLEQTLFRGVNKRSRQTREFHSTVERLQSKSLDFLEDCHVAELPVDSWCEGNLKRMNIERLSRIQAEAIPKILAGNDVVCQAPTGSGKTLAYLIPVVVVLKKHSSKLGFRCLVVLPTRELSNQIFDVFEKLVFESGFNSWTPGKNLTPKNKDLAISTPLRLLNMLHSRTSLIAHVKFVILDEVDKLLQLGLSSHIDEIITVVHSENKPKTPQILAFSATLSTKENNLCESVMIEPLRISIGAKGATATGIVQELIYVTKESGKIPTLRILVSENKLVPPCLIFVNTVERAQTVFNELVYDSMMVGTLHSGRTAKQRDQIICDFKSGNLWTLIVTDVMARGTHIEGVNTIINYDIPQTSHTYIHRVGRTARAGRTGKAITFYTDEDVFNIKVVTDVIRRSGGTVPSWLDHRHRNKKRSLTKR